MEFAPTWLERLLRTLDPHFPKDLRRNEVWWSAAWADVAAVERAEPGSLTTKGLVDGSLRARLHIRLRNGDGACFVVNRLDDLVASLTTRVG